MSMVCWFLGHVWSKWERHKATRWPATDKLIRTCSSCGKTEWHYV